MCLGVASGLGLLVGGGILAPDAANQDVSDSELLEAGGFAGGTFLASFFGCAFLTND